MSRTFNAVILLLLWVVYKSNHQFYFQRNCVIVPKAVHKLSWATAIPKRHRVKTSTAFIVTSDPCYLTLKSHKNKFRSLSISNYPILFTYMYIYTYKTNGVTWRCVFFFKCVFQPARRINKSIGNYSLL